MSQPKSLERVELSVVPRRIVTEFTSLTWSVGSDHEKPLRVEKRKAYLLQLDVHQDLPIRRWGSLTGPDALLHDNGPNGFNRGTFPKLRQDHEQNFVPVASMEWINKKSFLRISRVNVLRKPRRPDKDFPLWQQND